MTDPQDILAELKKICDGRLYMDEWLIYRDQVEIMIPRLIEAMSVAEEKLKLISGPNMYPDLPAYGAIELAKEALTEITRILNGDKNE